MEMNRRQFCALGTAGALAAIAGGVSLGCSSEGVFQGRPRRRGRHGHRRRRRELQPGSGRAHRGRGHLGHARVHRPGSRWQEGAHRGAELHVRRRRHLLGGLPDVHHGRAAPKRSARISTAAADQIREKLRPLLRGRRGRPRQAHGSSCRRGAASSWTSCTTSGATSSSPSSRGPVPAGLLPRGRPVHPAQDAFDPHGREGHRGRRRVPVRHHPQDPDRRRGPAPWRAPASPTTRPVPPVDIAAKAVVAGRRRVRLEPGVDDEVRPGALPSWAASWAAARARASRPAWRRAARCPAWRSPVSNLNPRHEAGHMLGHALPAPRRMLPNGKRFYCETAVHNAASGLP